MASYASSDNPRTVPDTDRPTKARVAFDFALVALIWGSTWLVIKDQIGAVPPGWTITWRFAVASVGMVCLALARGESLRIGPVGLKLAAAIGLLQFAGNFQFVYRAEHHVTSGIVATLYALLMVFNALLARAFLGARPTKAFLAGSVIAVAGVGLMLVHEYRLAPPGTAVPAGIALTLAGISCASSANVLQATRLARTLPIVPLMAWAMIFGVLFDAMLALALEGPPRLDPRPAYLGGIAYLAIAGSVVTFPLYSGLIRSMGAGRAGYNGVAVPVVAMALSTVFEGYRWGPLAAGGAGLGMLGLLIALAGRKD